MSAATELAKAEAARAEAEHPDEEEEAEESETATPAEPAPESEPEPTTPPDQPLTPEQVEKRYKQAGKVAERYADALAKALGPELMANMVVSPLDALPGFVQVDQHGQVEPSVKAQTLMFLSVEAPPEYKQNEATKTCWRCSGEGDLLTGSKRKTNLLTQCPDCGGLGYTDAHGNRIGAAPVAAATATASNGQTLAPAIESHAPGDPRVAELRAAGYTVLEPIHMGS